MDPPIVPGFPSSCSSHLRPKGRIGISQEDGKAGRFGDWDRARLPAEGGLLPRRAAREQRYQKAADATVQYVTSPITLRGQSFTPAQIVSTLTAVRQADVAVDAARQAVVGPLQAQRAALAAALRLYNALKSYLLGVYGKDSPVILAFGMGPTPVPPTVETKAAAVAKAKVHGAPAQGTSASTSASNGK